MSQTTQAWFGSETDFQTELCYIMLNSYITQIVYTPRSKVNLSLERGASENLWWVCNTESMSLDHLLTNKCTIYPQDQQHTHHTCN